MLSIVNRSPTGEEPIPLVAVGLEIIRQIVASLPKFLDFDNLLADGCRRTRLVLQISGRGEVIGTRMRVEDPLKRVSLLAGVFDQRICRMRVGRSRHRVEVQEETLPAFAWSSRPALAALPGS